MPLLHTRHHDGLRLLSRANFRFVQDLRGTRAVTTSSRLWSAADGETPLLTCATLAPTPNPYPGQVREDVTRYRYGDEQHLDEALDRIFRFNKVRAQAGVRSWSKGRAQARVETVIIAHHVRAACACMALHPRQAFVQRHVKWLMASSTQAPRPGVHIELNLDSLRPG